MLFRSRMDPRLAERYGFRSQPAQTDTTAAAKSTNVLENLKVKFRAVNLNRTGRDSSANGKLAFVVENAIQSSPFFDKTGTKLDGQLDQVGQDEDTFTFGMILKLRLPGAEATAASAPATASVLDPAATEDPAIIQ